MDSIASLSNAFQRLIILREIFLLQNLNPAGSNLNHSPLACLCVEKEESSLPLPMRVPSQIPWLPQTLHLLIATRAQQGQRQQEKESEVTEKPSPFPFWPTLWRGSTQGSRAWV